MANLSAKQKKIVNDTRAWFKEQSNRDIMLSDEMVSLTIEKAGDAYDDWDDEQSIKFWMNAEKTVEKVSVTDMGISVLVAKLDDNAIEEIGNEIEAVMKGKITALNLYSHFKRIYTKDELDSMPYPGTDNDSKIGNYKLDIVKKKAANGDVITTVWSNDFVSALGWGKTYEDALEDIAKEEKAEKSSKSFKGWSKQDLLSAKADFTARRNALRSMIKKTIELHHQFEAVLGMQKVGIEWIQVETPNAKHVALPKGFGKKEPSIKVTVSPKPLWIYPQGNQGKGKVYSIGQLLAFDVQTAITKGGSMSDLTDTSSKGADDAANSEGDGSNMDKTQALDTFNRAVNYLNKRENMVAYRQILANKKDSERRDALETLSELYHLIAPIYSQFKKDIQDVTGSKQEEVKQEEDTEAVA